MGDFVASEIPPLSSILYLFGNRRIGSPFLLKIKCGHLVTA